jgi:YYY domain-containing protein
MVLAESDSILDKLLLGSDMLPFLKWWLVIFLLGIIFMPLSDLLFSGLYDKGYFFSKAIGIAVTGYLMWMLSAIKLMRFSTISSITVVSIGLVINLLIILYKQLVNKANAIKPDPIGRLVLSYFHKERLRIYIKEELIFFLVFLFFTYIRGFKPEAYGTEKFMDYGFMTSMMRSDYMPPQDFWFSGTPLNYYYLGQFIATFLSRISFVNVSHGYNLMLMMLGAFAFVLPFSIAYNLIMRFASRHNMKAKPWARLGGLLAGMGVCVAGNMHYPIYRWIIPSIKKLTTRAKTGYNYWFPDATRYIGYNPETGDKTIHEFPSYSFILGDLHAHVINIVFVLTVLAILLSWLYKQRDSQNTNKIVTKEIVNPQIVMLGFFIGLFHTTNYWDYPIYYVVSGAIILFSNMIDYNFKAKAYWLTGIQGIFITVIAKLVALPFTLQFDQISAEARLVENRTPLYQFCVLWALPIITVLVFLFISIIDFVDKNNRLGRAKRGIKFKIIRTGRLLSSYMTSLADTDLYIITIGLCAIGLVFLPELVYVKDIYSGDYKRANTMFKLTYQAFIMFGICFGYIYIRLLRYRKGIRHKVILTISLFAFSLTLLYPVNGVKSWYGNIFNKKAYKGISATGFMEEDFKDDYLATKWLIDNVTGTPVVLEANGYSYTKYQRVSVITGLPTVLGWYTHEQLWKSGPDMSNDVVVSQLDARARDIEDIYTSQDKDHVSDLIEKYKISYIYVGALEEEKYLMVNHQLLRSLGQVVFENPNPDEYRTYIVKIY